MVWKNWKFSSSCQLESLRQSFRALVGSHCSLPEIMFCSRIHPLKPTLLDPFTAATTAWLREVLEQRHDDGCFRQDEWLTLIAFGKLRQQQAVTLLLPSHSNYLGFHSLTEPAQLGAFIAAQASIVWGQQLTQEMSKLAGPNSTKAGTCLANLWCHFSDPALFMKLQKAKVLLREMVNVLQELPGHGPFIAKNIVETATECIAFEWHCCCFRRPKFGQQADAWLLGRPCCGSWTWSLGVGKVLLWRRVWEEELWRRATVRQQVVPGCHNLLQGWLALLPEAWRVLKCKLCGASSKEPLTTTARKLWATISGDHEGILVSLTPRSAKDRLDNGTIIKHLLYLAAGEWKRPSSVFMLLVAILERWHIESWYYSVSAFGVFFQMWISKAAVIGRVLSLPWFLALLGVWTCLRWPRSWKKLHRRIFCLFSRCLHQLDFLDIKAITVIMPRLLFSEILSDRGRVSRSDVWWLMVVLRIQVCFSRLVQMRFFSAVFGSHVGYVYSTMGAPLCNGNQASKRRFICSRHLFTSIAFSYFIRTADTSLTMLADFHGTWRIRVFEFQTMSVPHGLVVRKDWLPHILAGTVGCVV